MELKNVNVIKKANLYFDGKVTSRTIIKEDKSRITLGVMLPGEYDFSTTEKEIMEVLGGVAEVKLSNEIEAKTYVEGSSFVIPANDTFHIKVVEPFDYLCSYIKE